MHFGLPAILFQRSLTSVILLIAANFAPTTEPIIVFNSGKNADIDRHCEIINRDSLELRPACDNDRGAVRQPSIVGTEPKSAKAKRYYLIGNSLTWDTVPELLDGDVQFHVDCAKSLPLIKKHPQSPCVASSTPWPKALAENQYDYVSVQPHYGSTLAEDVGVISEWVEMQKNAIFVIHTGWAKHASRVEEFASTNTSGPLVHSQSYIDALIGELKKRFPQRTFRQTQATIALAQIADDIANGAAPMTKLEELYRDDIHMTLNHGRYLMHNLMRDALGQPPSSVGFTDAQSPSGGMNPDWIAYLNSIIESHRSPSSTDLPVLN